MYPNSYQGEVHNIDADALSGANYISNPSANYATPEGGCGNTSSPLIASAGTYDDRFAEGAEGYVITYGGAPNWSRVGFTPSWYNASGQTLSYTNLGGARANIAFTGSRITRRYTMAPNRGQAQIYIDGVYRETMNDQAPEIRWQVAKTWELPYGTHTLEVSNNGGGGYIDVDSFIVDLSPLPSGSYDDYQTYSIQYIGSWTASASFPSAYNSTVHYSNIKEAAAGTTFRGSQVTYVYTKAANRGYAMVTIDGVNQGYIDLYSPTTQWQASTTWNLNPGIHTIFIGVAGIRNSASSDTYVDVDRFVAN